MREGVTNFMFDDFAGLLRLGRLTTESGLLRFYQDNERERVATCDQGLSRPRWEREGAQVAKRHLREKQLEQDEWAGDGTHQEIFGKGHRRARTVQERPLFWLCSWYVWVFTTRG